MCAERRIELGVAGKRNDDSLEVLERLHFDAMDDRGDRSVARNPDKDPPRPHPAGSSLCATGLQP